VNAVFILWQQAKDVWKQCIDCDKQLNFNNQKEAVPATGWSPLVFSRMTPTGNRRENNTLISYNPIKCKDYLQTLPKSGRRFKMMDQNGRYCNRNFCRKIQVKIQRFESKNSVERKKCKIFLSI
jgi:hypothetical protein